MDLSQRMKDLILPPTAPMIRPSNMSGSAPTTVIGGSGIPTAAAIMDMNERKGVRRAPGDLSSITHVRVPKNNQTRAMITKALKSHYLFSSLDQGEIDEMIDVMAMVTIQAGENVISQGTPGNCFYVLESGSCDIIVDNELVGKYNNGDAFGELALLYNCPRAATIRAMTGCILWTVERTTFCKIMATTASATQLARVNFLKNVELLQRLSNNQLQKVAAALKLQRFNDGDYIIHQGDDGNTFYIIVEGKVRCTSRGGGASSDPVEKELMMLYRGNYFGEMALMLNEPRQANCIAVGNVDCYVMDRAQFTKLLGPLCSLIDRQMRIRVLRSVPLLSLLTDDELDLLAHALNVISFEDNSVIIREGDAGDTFYMISVEASERKLSLQLPKSCHTLPPSRVLLKVARAMSNCLYQGEGETSQTNRDLLLAVSLTLWHEYAMPILNELNATEPPELPKSIVKVASELLLAIHLALTFVDADDLLLHGEVVLRLSSLLRLQKRNRLAIQGLRGLLERINSKRDELASFDTHFEALSKDSVALSCSTISFDVDSELSYSDAREVGARNARDRVGVFGTGSQFGSFFHDICCLQTDLVLLLYEIELEDASNVGALPFHSTTATSDRHQLEPGTLLETMEAKLTTECRKNGYNRVLLNIQLMRHHHANKSSSTEKLEALADNSTKMLQRIETHERELRNRLKKASSAASEAQNQGLSADSNVPLPPVVISRSSTAITVTIPVFQPSQPSLRKRQIAYYMVFAKPAGAGIAVSLNNDELPGTAEPVYPPQRQVAISGLLPNESYVFAVAAFDKHDEVIQGIGQTSDPAIALHPLSVVLCYGYLVQACYELNLLEQAPKAARTVYSTIVSRAASSRQLWQANPFYRHALKREVVAKLPISILNVAIHAIQILCHEELGDEERDGMLHDPEQRSLLSHQVTVLEACRRVAIGIELASAAANMEAIHMLCFKGYRLMLPLLHLHRCDAMTFAPLMTMYHALQTIPRAQWGVDTKSIFARIAFELFRIGLENRHCEPVIFPSLVHDTLQPQNSNSDQLSNGAAWTKSNEYHLFCETIALREALHATRSTAVHAHSGAPIVAAITKNLPGTPAAPTSKAAAVSSTPQGTPRQPGGTEEQPKLPLLQELLQQVNFSVVDALKALDASTSTSGIEHVEYACKLATVALQSGNESAVEACLASVKLKGKTSHQFRSTISRLGGASLLHEPAGSDPASSAELVLSPPTTARPTTKTPRQQNPQMRAAKDEPASPNNVTEETPPSSRGSQAVHEDMGGEDDDFLYLWGGEVFFIQSLLLYRRIVKLRAEIREVDAAHGPEYDPTFDLLRAEHHHKGHEPVPDDRHHAGSLEQESQEQESRGHSKEDELMAGFGQFIEKISASCELFRLGKAWQALQVSCQYLWNAIWIVWISPDRFECSFLSSPHWLEQFSGCIDFLLDMIETVVTAVQEQKSKGLTSFSTGMIDGTQIQALELNQSLLQTSLASTMVVSSAVSAMSTDLTWVISFVSYGIKALCSAHEWEKIVHIGKKVHFLLGNQAVGTRFSELNFPVLIYAQRQLFDIANDELDTATTELDAYIRGFTESEAKKKKRKSRLVVEEVLTPEELAFRAKKAAMDEHIQLLTEARNQQRDELQQLTIVYEGLTKVMNKCLQSLDAAHELIAKFHRTKNDDGDRITLKNQIVSGHNYCILLSRQKRQQRLLCHAYQELGDFYLACCDTKLAVKYWHEGLDNAFGTLNIVQNWRDVLVCGSKDQGVNGISGADVIGGDSLWVGLLSCSMLSKLVMHATSSSCFQPVEYSLVAAKVFGRLFASSLPHPTKEFLFGSYELGNEFWPGRDLLVDSERVSSFLFGVTLILVPEVLLQYEYYAVVAMPVIAGYEFVARHCLESRDHVANARRLRIEALLQCGRIKEVMLVLAEILHGVEAPSTQEASKPNLLLAALSYHDNKPVKHEANAAALAWLLGFDVAKIHAELTQSYAEPLVFEILVGILRLMVCLSRHESSLGSDSVQLRSSAEKTAQALLHLIREEKRKESMGETETKDPHQLSWDDVQLAALRGEVLL
ncbi:Agc protein kinase, partial [Globisporangium splendens]